MKNSAIDDVLAKIDEEKKASQDLLNKAESVRRKSIEERDKADRVYRDAVDMKTKAEDAIDRLNRLTRESANALSNKENSIRSLTSDLGRKQKEYDELNQRRDNEYAQRTVALEKREKALAEKMSRYNMAVAEYTKIASSIATAAQRARETIVD